MQKAGRGNYVSVPGFPDGSRQPLARAGELLAEMDKQDGGDAMRARSHVVTEVPPTLAALGVTKMQSSRWQVEAEVPEETFEAYVAEAPPRVRRPIYLA